MSAKKEKGFRFTGFTLGLLITAAMAVFFLSFSESFQLFKFFELKALDMRFRLRGPKPSNDNIVIAVIDDASIEALGRWPWPRRRFGRLIDKLNEDGAKVIGFDIIFSEPEDNELYVRLRQLKMLYDHKGLPNKGPDARAYSEILQSAVDSVPQSDLLLAEAMEDGGNVISTLVFYTDPSVKRDRFAPLVANDEAGDEDIFLPEKVRGEAYQNISGGPNGPMFEMPVATGVLMPIEEFVDASLGLGFVNFIPDIDGGLRWENLMVEFAGKQYPPIGVRMLMEYYGYGPDELAIVKGKGLRLGPVLIPTDSQGRMLVNYYGGFGAIKYYSISEIIEGRTPPGTFRDKLVLVGGAATGLGDVWLTPFAPTLPGVEKHATVISNILDGNFLSRPGWLVYLELGFIIFIGVLLGFAIPRLKSVAWVVVFTGGVLAALLVVNYQIFIRAGIWVNLTYPVVTLLAVSVGVVVYQYFTEEKEKRFIKKAFKQYLNEALVEQLASSPEGLTLGGQQKELTVLFSDIRSFTTISEGLTPEQLVSLINTYLSLMTRIIMEEQGTVDKYIGDAIMAIYGAPLYYDAHPAQACRSALRMMDGLQKAKPEWRERGFPEINIGIGINTGQMVVGNMGSEDRFDYTVMGDSVNLASRLEGLCKTYGAGIVISEFTAAPISGFVVRELDLVKVKGKDKPIKILEVLSEGEPDATLATELAEYASALAAYRAMRWDEAIAAFGGLHERTGVQVYRIYQERCAAFKASPPQEPWDGVYTFTTK